MSDSASTGTSESTTDNSSGFTNIDKLPLGTLLQSSYGRAHLGSRRRRSLVDSIRGKGFAELASRARGGSRGTQ